VVLQAHVLWIKISNTLVGFGRKLGFAHIYVF
jgi:hypothetical protein